MQQSRRLVFDAASGTRVQYYQDVLYAFSAVQCQETVWAVKLWHHVRCLDVATTIELRTMLFSNLLPCNAFLQLIGIL
jgi:hypothetical protein